MRGALWFAIVGVLLVGMVAAGTLLRRLPVTTSMLYLAVGGALGGAGLGFITADPIRDASWIERVAEVAVLVSLFGAGLKLRTALTDKRWHMPVRLATLVMVLTIGAVTLIGVYAMALPLGAAVLLAAILAPTDPVLASDVQVEHPTDTRPAALRAHRRGRAERRHRVPVRHARPRAARAPRPRRVRLALARRRRRVGAASSAARSAGGSAGP